jgi:hypothetical protein
VDKKAKKKQDILRQQLSGARKQMDDREEVLRLEKDVATTESELAKLK